jgi:glycosyltransferase involved in cell wall biosynthesis
MRILFCGLSGIPNKASASINRYMAIGQALSRKHEVIFINRFPLFKEIEQQSNEVNDLSKVIDATNIKYRPKSFIKRNFLKLTSFLHEYWTIRSLSKEQKIDWLNIYTQYFGILLFYYYLSKIFNFKTILHYVEFRSKSIDRSWIYWINDLLFDKFAVFLCDKIIVISTALNSYILELNHTSNTLIIPPICDFKYFDTIKPEITDRKYFVFCASVSYEDVFLFIIESFLKLSNQEEITLHLVTNGKLTNQEIKQLLEANKERISVFSNMEYKNLIAKYKGSMAQLIPLRNSLQDSARFPQKICEFVASQRPIITTGYGEINHYFTDNFNALIATDYNITNYSQKMEWVLKNPDKLQTIANNSYLSGLNYFDIHGYSQKIEKFLTT